ncbi:MAG TPA: hypothetical protein VGU68_06115 [Ktedonobacteraceae bacterium]|nr:hypothetical protein [Ktedonobacteraceae bacterium]
MLTIDLRSFKQPHKADSRIFAVSSRRRIAEQIEDLWLLTRRDISRYLTPPDGGTKHIYNICSL